MCAWPLLVRLIGDAPGTPAHNYQSASYIHGRGYEMPHGLHNVRVRRLMKSAAATFRVNDWTLNQIDLDGLRYLATISVRANWFVATIAVIELVYRSYLVSNVKTGPQGEYWTRPVVSDPKLDSKGKPANTAAASRPSQPH